LDDDGSRQGERDPQVVITDMRYRTAIRVLVRHIIELRAAQERAAIAPAPAPAERSADEEREERMLALRVALDRARAERAALRRWASKEAGHPA
jgi:hypothetical protein